MFWLHCTSGATRRLEICIDINEFLVIHVSLFMRGTFFSNLNHRLRKNHGNELERARDLFYALWIPDLFMKRVEAGMDRSGGEVSEVGG